MNTDTIKKLLNEGATPESIYQEAKRIKEAEEAAKDKVRQKEIAEARQDVVDDLGYYMELVLDTELTDEDYSFLKGSMDAFEDSLTREKKKGTKVKVDKELNDDVDKYIKLLRYML